MGSDYPLYPAVSNRERYFLLVHRPIRLKCFIRLLRSHSDEIPRQSWPLFRQDAHGSTMPDHLVLSRRTLANSLFFTSFLKTALFHTHKRRLVPEQSGVISADR